MSRLERIESVLVKAEMEHSLEMMKLDEEHAKLRALLVEKWGEEGVCLVEEAQMIKENNDEK